MHLPVIAAAALFTLSDAPVPDYPPNAVCVETTCAEILYSWGGGVVAAQVILSDESFLTYVPACYGDCDNYGERVAHALRVQVQQRFPQARLHNP